MDVHIKNLLINPQNTGWFIKYQAIIGVFTTALIAYLLYRIKEKENRIKNVVSDLFLLFFSIKENFEQSYAIWKSKSIIVLEELERNLKLLDKMKYLADCYNKKQNLETHIEFPNEESYKNYILTLLNEVGEKIRFEYAYRSIMNSLNEKNSEENALFLVTSGNPHFQAIYKTLLRDYGHVNKIITDINECIKIKDIKQRTQNILLFDSLDPNYEEVIEQKIQEVLYLKNLYEELTQALEYVVLYSDIAIDHLIAFRHHYKVKNKQILSRLNINIEFKFDNNLFNVKELNYIDISSLNCLHLWIIPLYKCFRLNLFDKLINVMLNLFQHRKVTRLCDPETSSG